MTPTAMVRDTLDDLSRLSPQLQVVRALLLLGPVLVVVAELGAGGSSGWVYLAFVVVLALLAAVLPDSGFGLVLLVTQAVHWTGTVEDRLSPWLLLAVTGVVLLHVCAVLATYGPPASVLPGELLGRWAWRAARMLGAAVLVWFGVGVVSLAGVPGSALLVAVTLGVLCVAALLVVRASG